MNTELLKELELLSGWDIPEHDVLEFLLEKLPHQLSDDFDAPLTLVHFGQGWEATYPDGYASHRAITVAPKYSLMVLAIMLFKEGILTK